MPHIRNGFESSTASPLGNSIDNAMPSEGAKRLQTRARLLAFSLNIRAHVNIYMCMSLQCPRETMHVEKTERRDTKLHQKRHPRTKCLLPVNQETPNFEEQAPSHE
jgi:hypothetical protein